MTQGNPKFIETERCQLQKAVPKPALSTGEKQPCPQIVLSDHTHISWAS